jgi:D-sedoheptulose 7-phosphate isomerase
VSGLAEVDLLEGRLRAALAQRTAASRSFFDAEAGRLAELCHRMAERFARGGRLLALGRSPTARSDARHVAVEFVHPVIVGKRALPALALCAEGGDLCAQVSLVAEPDDVVLAFECDDQKTAAALQMADERGCLTVAFAGAQAGAQRWQFVAPSDDSYVRQELSETLYHVLWELVHVFFEHRGLLEGRSARPLHDAGASSFLYPFLAESEQDLDAVMTDVRASVLMKAREVEELREQTLLEGAATLSAAARALVQRLLRGGRLLAAGNGGSATDAMDVVADFRAAAAPGWSAWPALDLTEDAAILTAIANDVGVEATFSRQVIAHGRGADALLTLSTSGSSANVIAALAEARQRELLTIAFVGYDGGQIAAHELADHVIVTRSSHIPRIQEAQASAYHLLRELVALADDGEPRMAPR